MSSEVIQDGIPSVSHVALYFALCHSICWEETFSSGKTVRIFPAVDMEAWPWCQMEPSLCFSVIPVFPSLSFALHRAAGHSSLWPATAKPRKTSHSFRQGPAVSSVGHDLAIPCPNLPVTSTLIGTASPAAHNHTRVTATPPTYELYFEIVFLPAEIHAALKLPVLRGALFPNTHASAEDECEHGGVCMCLEFRSDRLLS